MLGIVVLALVSGLLIGCIGIGGVLLVPALTFLNVDVHQAIGASRVVLSLTQMRHGALLSTIDFTEFGFVVRAGSSTPLTNARLRQCCFLFRNSHREYEERLFWQC
jgi:hypothetical protein